MNNIKLLFITTLAMLMAACGPGGKNDQNTPPPDVSSFSVEIETPMLMPSDSGTETKLVVDFNVLDGAGRDYTFDTDKDFRIAVLKAMPARSDVEDTSDPATTITGVTAIPSGKVSITPVMLQITEHQWRVFGMAI